MAAMLKSSVATEFHSNRLKTMPSGMKIGSQPVLLSRRAMVAAWKACSEYCSPICVMVLRRRSRGWPFSSSKGCDSSEDKSPASMMKITTPLATVEPFYRSSSAGVVRLSRNGFVKDFGQAKQVGYVDYYLASACYSASNASQPC
jgi:hypothetical protein